MRYFVSYFQVSPAGGFGMGNAVVTIENAIASRDEIASIENWLKEKENIEQASLVSFILLPEEEKVLL